MSNIYKVNVGGTSHPFKDITSGYGVFGATQTMPSITSGATLIATVGYKTFNTTTQAFGAQTTVNLYSTGGEQSGNDWVASVEPIANPTNLVLTRVTPIVTYTIPDIVSTGTTPVTVLEGMNRFYAADFNTDYYYVTSQQYDIDGTTKIGLPSTSNSTIERTRRYQLMVGGQSPAAGTTYSTTTGISLTATGVKFFIMPDLVGINDFEDFDHDFYSIVQNNPYISFDNTTNVALRDWSVDPTGYEITGQNFTAGSYVDCSGYTTTIISLDIEEATSGMVMPNLSGYDLSTSLSNLVTAGILTTVGTTPYYKPVVSSIQIEYPRSALKTAATTWVSTISNGYAAPNSATNVLSTQNPAANTSLATTSSITLVYSYTTTPMA